MESDLLRKEQEFHKINSELEERTSRILQEIDAAKIKVGLLKESEIHQTSRAVGSRSQSFPLKSSILSSSHEEESSSHVKRDIVEDPLAIRSNGLGYEATNRLLRAKLTILNKEVDTLRQDYKSKSEECRKTTSELTRSEEECARLESMLSAVRDTAGNLQNKLEATSQNLTRTQNENLSLNKEVGTLKKDLKQQRQQSSAVELRLNRALEDIEKLRNTVKQTQLQNKEDREGQRRNIDQLQSKIKGLERQRSELQSLCSKQSHLIENLRRQKVHLEVTRFTHVAETEFDNVLDWCLKYENQGPKVNG